MDILKDLIGWRSYGQRDPLMEYRNEGFQTFLAMTNELRQGILYLLFRSELLFLNSKN
jgi:preprotein translocase subunit SecA